jgi:hypothetical protein
MPDPYSLFKASPGKHRVLAALWPELHDLLAGKVAEQEAEYVPPPVPCCIHPCSSRPSGKRPPSVARLHRWGPEACRHHIDTLADRPGGWPLDLSEHRL